MTSISQRELRNDNAEIMRNVENGESYTITRRGVPMARLGPLPEGPDLRLVKAAKRPFDPALLTRVESDRLISDILDDLRGDR